MREHILGVAEGLFYQEGIRAVGIDRIIAEAGVAKATLYSKFASKHDLVLAYLRARSDRIISQVNANLDTQPGSRRDKLFFLFDELERMAQPGSPFRGCAFMLAVGESAGDVDVRAIALHHKSRFRAIFEGLLAEEHVAASALAEQVAVCYEGALTLVALTGDASSLPAARRSIEAILAMAETHSTQSGP